MTVKHTLSSGGWVEVREPSELRAKDRKRAIRQMPDPEDGHQFSLMVDLSDLVAAAVIVAWSIPSMPDAPIPGERLDILDELTMTDENEIQRAILPLLPLFRPQAPSPDDYAKPDGTPNPESPTGPASA